MVPRRKIINFGTLNKGESNVATKNTAARIRNPNPDWKRGRKPLYVWVKTPLHSKLKVEAKAREISMRKLVSDVLESSSAVMIVKSPRCLRKP